MNATPRVLALMTALAAGTAAAATTNTTAGQIITNQATASFTDPTTLSAATPIVSNTVQTVVLPKPGFDIVYADGSSDNTTATTPAATYDKNNVLPGSTMTTSYVVVNTGNVNGYVVNLAADSAGGNAPQDVRYYLDANNDGMADSATPITSVTLNADNPNTSATDEGIVRILQVITVASTAATGAQYSASPAGSAPAGSVSVTDTSTGTTTAYPYAALTEAQANPASTNGDLQYTRVTVFTPSVTNAPADGDPAAAGQQPPTTTVVVPPSATTVIDPNNPTSAPGTPGSPSDPTQPGYTDPPVAGSTGAVAVTVIGNVQTAYPPADTNAMADTVNFKNTVTTPAGSPADTVNLFPVNPALNVGDAGYGAPYGTNNGDGSFTLPDGTVVRFLNADGSAPTLVTSPVDGKTYPVVSVPAGGATVGYVTQVSYPDSNSLSNPTPITVVVGADSGNDYNLVADATTTDRVLPPALQFGDSDASSPTANPGAQPTETVTPGAAVGSGAPVPGATADSSAVFPMDIANPGEYADTYTLSGSVQVPLSNGTTVTVSVRYVDSSGAELPRNAAGQYITPVVDPNSEYKVFAVVDIPATARLTVPGSPLTVFQTATSNYGNITLQDNNDRILVGTIGGITVDKYQAVGGAPTQDAAGKTNKAALPGETIYYAIVAKNSYNDGVRNFVLSDVSGGATNVYSFTTFQSASVVLNGFGAYPSARALYRVNGAGLYLPTAPALGSVTSGLDVVIDSNGDGAFDSADVFPSGATVTLNILATVK